MRLWASPVWIHPGEDRPAAYIVAARGRFSATAVEGVEHTIDRLQPAALGLRIGDDHAKVLARPDRCGVEAGGGKPSDLVVYGARLVVRAVAQELSSLQASSIRIVCGGVHNGSAAGPSSALDDSFLEVVNPRSRPSTGHRGVRESNGYRELDGTQLSGTLTRRTTSSTIVNPRFR